MKDLRFQKLHLVSHRERRGRTIEFDPVATVITGGNDVGKSSIAKSLFGTLGAPAAVEHPRWREASASALLQFSVDGAPYSMLRQGRTYTLFAGIEQIGTYTSVTSGVGPALAEILGVKLKLTDREDRLVVPPPAYMFLPFYCDQDKGWIETWSSFSNLAQFPRWKPEVINYHAGITTPTYFDALEQLALAKAERADPARELEALISLRKRATSMLGADVDIEPDSTLFAQEISLLVEKTEKLAAIREQSRTRIARLSERKLQLLAQKEILERVRKELHADYTFAVDSHGDEVECPTCGQMHENSFAQRFSIAQDEAKTGDLLIEVLDHIAENNLQLSSAKAGLEQTAQQEQEILELLTRKKGQVTFARLLERAGNKTFSAQLEEQIGALGTSVANIDARIAQARNLLEDSKSAEKRKVILDNYAATMGKHLRALNVTSLAEKHYSRIDCVLNETGSDRPRAILAYLFTILDLIWSSETALRCPIVLDSPNQQDQDAGNHLRMLEFIRDARPPESQLVIFAVDDCDIDFGGKRYVLEEKDFALSEKHYEDVAAQLRPFQAA
jgi:hypothetical protein